MTRKNITNPHTQSACLALRQHVQWVTHASQMTTPSRKSSRFAKPTSPGLLPPDAPITVLVVKDAGLSVTSRTRRSHRVSAQRGIRARRRRSKPQPRLRSILNSSHLTNSCQHLSSNQRHLWHTLSLLWDLPPCRRCLLLYRPRSFRHRLWQRLRLSYLRLCRLRQSQYHPRRLRLFHLRLYCSRPLVSHLRRPEVPSLSLPPLRCIHLRMWRPLRRSRRRLVIIAPLESTLARISMQMKLSGHRGQSQKPVPT